MTTTNLTTTLPTNKYARIAIWVLQVLAAAAFISAGGAKLAGVPMMVEIFDKVGVGQWFRYVTGSIEVASGLALLIPALAAFGAVMLVGTMAGAVVTHLFIIGGSPVPAILLLAITAIIAWFRRGTILARLQ
jgi:putative oxidoreductase